MKNTIEFLEQIKPLLTGVFDVITRIDQKVINGVVYSEYVAFKNKEESERHVPEGHVVKVLTPAFYEILIEIQEKRSAVNC
jgi:hypothetical protein